MDLTFYLGTLSILFIVYIFFQRFHYSKQSSRLAELLLERQQEIVKHTEEALHAQRKVIDLCTYNETLLEAFSKIHDEVQEVFKTNVELANTISILETEEFPAGDEEVAIASFCKPELIKPYVTFSEGKAFLAIASNNRCLEWTSKLKEINTKFFEEWQTEFNRVSSLHGEILRNRNENETES